MFEFIKKLTKFLTATLIPYDLDDIVEIHCKASFILVVEKESIFHKLLEEDLPNKLARPFILITVQRHF